MLQNGDELVSVESGLALWNAFASDEKMLVLNPGAHAAVPPFMFNINQQFFQRHLA